MAVLAAGTVLMMAALLWGKAGLVSTRQQLLSATNFVFKEKAARLQTKQDQNATAAHQQIPQNAKTVDADKKVVNVSRRVRLKIVRSTNPVCVCRMRTQMKNASAAKELPSRATKPAGNVPEEAQAIHVCHRKMLLTGLFLVSIIAMTAGAACAALQSQLRWSAWTPDAQRSSQGLNARMLPLLDTGQRDAWNQTNCAPP